MSDYKTYATGEPEKFVSGAIRDTNEAKPRYDLIPPDPLRRLADVYYRGGQLYGDNNWTQGVPCSRFLSSAMRHIEAARSGDKQEDHWAQAVWNIMGIMHFENTNWNDLVDWTPSDNNNQP